MTLNFGHYLARQDNAPGFRSDASVLEAVNIAELSGVNAGSFEASRLPSKRGLTGRLGGATQRTHRNDTYDLRRTTILEELS